MAEQWSQFGQQTSGAASAFDDLQALRENSMFSQLQTQYGISITTSNSTGRSEPPSCDTQDLVDEGRGIYSCACGWRGRADEIAFSRKHLLNLDGVLWSHKKGSRSGRYRCQVCKKNRDTLEEFGACLDSHRFGSDGVQTVKDAYGSFVEKQAPITSKTEEVKAFFGF